MTRSLFDGGPWLDAVRDDQRLVSMLQRVYLALKYAAQRGAAVPVDVLRQGLGPSADSRARDLRKPRFGGFSVLSVPCGEKGGRFAYYLDLASVTPQAEALVANPARERQRDTVTCGGCGGTGRVTADAATARKGPPRPLMGQLYEPPTETHATYEPPDVPGPEPEPLTDCSGCGTELDGSYCPKCDPPDDDDGQRSLF